MHYDRPHCRSLLLFLFATVVIACICASSVQSTGGDDDKPYLVSTIAGTGSGALKVNVPALEATFGGISGIAQSKTGDLYASIGEQCVVLKFEFDSIEGTWSNVKVIAGTGTEGRGGDDMGGTESAFDYPMGLSLIENSNGDVTAVLVADMNNNRIRQLDMSTQKITTIAGTGDQAFTGDGGSATAAKLYGPFSVYYDKSNGDIYIADTFNNRIRRVRDGTISTVVGTTCTGSDELGDGEQATDACLNTPSHFTMNDAGEWFIADNENNRIRKVFLNSTITTVAGGGTVTGDAPATSVKLSMPEGIAFTPSIGEMFVTESAGLFRGIRKMEKSGFMKIIAGGGSEAPSSNNPIPGKTAFIQPAVVAHARDGSDTIFIGDNRGYIFMLTNKTRCYGVEFDNSAVCSGHGACIGADQCQCNDGWMGLDCSITHCFGVTSNLPDRVCSGKGKCVRRNYCECYDGFRGHKCQRT